MSAREWFKEWFNTTYYHKLYFERDEAEAHHFIDRLISHLRPKDGSTMLDIGCGRGRHSRYLASKGYDLTGIDISPESISYAKQFENDHLTFYQHDMRMPFRINYYDYGFNFFTSFGYFYTRREHDDAMRTIAQALKPGGIIVFDYLNSNYVSSNLVADEIKQIDGIKYTIKRWQDKSHFYKRIKVSDPENKMPVEFTERVCKLTIKDFKNMFDLQKLEVIDIFGDYQLSPFDESKSPRLILAARKY